MVSSVETNMCADASKQGFGATYGSRWLQSSCPIIMEKISHIRPLVLLLLTFNIDLRARHLPGVNNTLCDNFSLPGHERPSDTIWDAGAPNSNTRTPKAQQLHAQLKDLFKDSLAESLLSLYSNHWESFAKFITTKLKSNVLPASEYNVCLYLVYLHSFGLKASSIQSYLPAIAFTHRVHGHTDPKNSFRVKKLMESLKRKSHRVTEREAITQDILKKIIPKIKQVVTDGYDRKLFSAVFLFNYHACLRISEVTQSKNCKHNLQFQNFAF